HRSDAGRVHRRRRVEAVAARDGRPDPRQGAQARRAPPKAPDRGARHHAARDRSGGRGEGAGVVRRERRGSGAPVLRDTVSPTRFRIGVDGRGFASPAGGVRRYVSELYTSMAHIAPDVDLVAIGAPTGAALPPNATVRPARAFPTTLGWMAASLPLAVRGAGLDVFHAPAYTAPLWGVHPQAVTIHDVSYERRPEWNAYRNDPFRRPFYRR